MRLIISALFLSLRAQPLLAQGLPPSPIPDITECSRALGTDRTICDSRTFLHSPSAARASAAAASAKPARAA